MSQKYAAYIPPELRGSLELGTTPAEDMTYLLNSYFEEMNNIISK